MNRTLFIVIFAVFVAVFLVIALIKATESPSDSKSDLRADFRNDNIFKASDLPQPGVCGPYELPHRILGGDITEITEFPWTVLVEHTRDDGSISYHCGGTLINKDYVLTAAHCVNGKSLLRNNWKVTGVRLGEWNLNTDPDCQDDLCAAEVIDIPLAESIVHEDYKPYSRDHENDIALLRLKQSVEFTDWIKPLCLPIASVLRDKDYGNETVLTVAGWGRTENALFSDFKLTVDLSGVPFNECAQKFRAKGVNLTGKQLCVGGEKGKDACKGDSGGAIFLVDMTNPRKPFTFQTGIVSFGKKSCGTEGWPGVYTRVDRYMDWILQHMKP